MMFEQLNKITQKPDLYCCYTAGELWNDPYISGQMLKNHLNPAEDLASRKMDFIEASVAFMQKRFSLGEGKRIIDFGCGPGLYTARFSRLGCQVRGLDFSVNSIEYARADAARLGLDIEYLNLNYLDYHAQETFDLATMIYCDYCVLNDEQRKTLLKSMQNSLKDDGCIFLDVCSAQMYEKFHEGTTLEIAEKDGFWSARRNYVFKSTFKYDLQRVSLEKYTVFEENRNIEIYNWLKHFTLAELTREFAESGLKILEVYSDVQGTPFNTESDIMAVVAVKQDFPG